MKIITNLLVLIALLSTKIALAEFNYSMHPEKVAENVYAILTPTRDFPNPENGGWNSNSAFVITDEGVLLFDTGSSAAIGQALRDTIATVTDKPVRWIVNSHAHGDHWLGNVAFVDTVKTIYATTTVTGLIENDGQRWVANFKEMTNGLTGESRIVKPTLTVDERLELNLGGTQMALMQSGGSHSPGDLMLWLPKQKVLIAGDVVYSDRMPSTNAGDLNQWIDTLGFLQNLNPKVVIPGHGKLTDQQGLIQLQSLFRALWMAVAKGIDEGMSDFEMLPQISQALDSFKPLYPGLEDKLKRDLSHVYLQVEEASFK